MMEFCMSGDCSQDAMNRIHRLVQIVTEDMVSSGVEVISKFISELMLRELRKGDLPYWRDLTAKVIQGLIKGSFLGDVFEHYFHIRIIKGGKFVFQDYFGGPETRVCVELGAMTRVDFTTDDFGRGEWKKGEYYVPFDRRWEMLDSFSFARAVSIDEVLTGDNRLFAFQVTRRSSHQASTPNGIENIDTILKKSRHTDFVLVFAVPIGNMNSFRLDGEDTVKGLNVYLMGVPVRVSEEYGSVPSTERTSGNTGGGLNNEQRDLRNMPTGETRHSERETRPSRRTRSRRVSKVSGATH
jgi:hypothetical protein